MAIFKLVLNTIPRPYLIKLSYCARPFLSAWLKGDRYTDPIDGKSFKRFLPYGYGKQRPNVLSPSTLSLERHRLLWLYLKNETSFFTENLKVLHMAPEQCFLDIFKKAEISAIFRQQIWNLSLGIDLMQRKKIAYPNFSVLNVVRKIEMKELSGEHES